MPASARRLRSLSRHLSRGDLRGALTTAAAEDGRVAVAAPDAVVITRIRAFRVAPYGTPLCIVKVETSRPGVHGVGCATFTQRQELVAQAVEQYLDPFLRGRDVQQTTDIWYLQHLRREITLRQNFYSRIFWRGVVHKHRRSRKKFKFNFVWVTRFARN